MKYTDNLKLFKYEPEKDGKQPFSIEKALNENWDKIDADRSAWARSLQGKSNTDLSNLSEQGSKVIDGQWVSKYANLSTSKSIGVYNINLSNYLPSDSYNYEVIVKVFGDRNSTNTACIYLSSSLCANGYDGTDSHKGADVTTYQNARVQSNSRVIPIGADRIITMRITGATLTDCGLTVVAYRRIGTNE